MRLAGVLVLLGTQVAIAQPTRCHDLATPTSFARLDDKAKAKLGEEYTNPVRTPFRKLVVTVSIERAPHIARAVLLDCPGIEQIIEATATDDRHFESEVRLHATSFAALMRISQLPAVTSIGIYDPTLSRPHKPPMRPIDRFD